MAKDWFEVDRTGLAAALTARGIEFAVGELVQNAWDADVVANVSILLESLEHRPVARLVVEDDSPVGFVDLAHTYRLFGGSTKGADPTKRGKWDLGEKLVFALAKEARVETTIGTVWFDEQGRHRSGKKRERGSRVEAILPMTRNDLTRCADFVRRILPPPEICCTFNGDRLASREPIASVRAYLETEIADEHGKLRRKSRDTSILVHQPKPGEVAFLYEMGLPVQETGDAWHYDIQQRVPVGLDRDSVSDWYLQLVRSAVANAMAARIPDASATWVTKTMESSTSNVAAVREIVRKRFGEKAVAYDPSNTEAVAKAVANGYTVVSGGSLSAAAWDSVRRADVLPPAGRIFPKPTPADFDEVPESEITEGMRRVQGYVRRLGHHLLGIEPLVRFIRQTNGVAASWARESKRIMFNLDRLDGSWWPEATCLSIPDKTIELILHEFGHEGEGCDNHLSAAYYDNLCRMGALMRHTYGWELGG